MATAAAVRLYPADGQPRALWVAPAGEPTAPAPRCRALWQWGEVRSGIATITRADRRAFVPQMLNYESVGGVNFKKGCYPGQEVVARSQFRGTLKRRTLLFDCVTLPVVGQDVFASGAPGEPAGTVANAAQHPAHSGGSALIEVRLAAVGEELRLGAADGPPLRRRELPYIVPLEATAAS